MVQHNGLIRLTTIICSIGQNGLWHEQNWNYKTVIRHAKKKLMENKFND